MIIRCNTCDISCDTIGFDRDDPILACGHTITKINYMNDVIYTILRDEIYALMHKRNMSYTDAKNMFWSDNYDQR